MSKACVEDEATLLKFVLGSGSRDQEIRHVEWKNIDLRNQFVRVDRKAAMGFTLKNSEEHRCPCRQCPWSGSGSSRRLATRLPISCLSQPARSS
jgi:integrase